MGSWRLQGRERFVVPAMVFAVVFAVVGVVRFGLLDGGSADDVGDGGDGGGAGASPMAGTGGSSGSGRTGQQLEAASYAAGDCVTWENLATPADTEVVPCTEPHWLQMTEEVRVSSGSGGFPTDEEWGLVIQAQCGPAAERFLGTPLDPYGRFYADAIYPSEEGWDSGDENMWCAIGWSGPRDGSGDARFAEDVRGADPADHYGAGTCLSTLAGPTLVVDCAEPHDKEIIGEVDLSDRPERPSGAHERALGDECAAQARAYLGADPVMPWQIGRDTMTEESWAAGSRAVHCFLGQWDAQQEPIEVTGSAKA